MDLSKSSQCWRIPDELWAKVKLLLPPGKPHPLGCHRPRVDDRKAMEAIFYRLRTGCQWKALDATGICSSSSAHRRFQEWTQAGVFRTLWAQGLLDYDDGRKRSRTIWACSVWLALGLLTVLQVYWDRL